MSIYDNLLARIHGLAGRSGRAGEARRAARYWGSLRTYHETNEDDPLAIERSRFVADVLVAELGIRSLLEIGPNTGRNLGIVKAAHPALRAKGIDVNPRALARARSLYPNVEFELQDANQWTEAPGSWDGILTMSVLDHIPDGETRTLASKLADAARFVICVELWDGEHGTRGLYKYSRDTRQIFESVGVRTLRWEMSPGQYDLERSPLWLYVGETGQTTASSGTPRRS